MKTQCKIIDLGSFINNKQKSLAGTTKHSDCISDGGGKLIQILLLLLKGAASCSLVLKKDCVKR